MARLSQAIADAVALDGLPRQAADETGAIHVLYLESDRVRSMLAADWPPPLPSDPTPAESAAAIAARQAAAQQELIDLAATRAKILAIVHPIVGQSIDTPLTNAQTQALLRLVVRELGGVTPQGTWAPLGSWVRR